MKDLISLQFCVFAIYLASILAVNSPRPQLVLEKWMRLNGLWESTVRQTDEEKPEQFDRKKLDYLDSYTGGYDNSA